MLFVQVLAIFLNQFLFQLYIAASLNHISIPNVSKTVRIRAKTRMFKLLFKVYGALFVLFYPYDVNLKKMKKNLKIWKNF